MAIYLDRKAFRTTFAAQCKKINIQSVPRNSFSKGKVCNVSYVQNKYRPSQMGRPFNFKLKIN